MLLQNQSVTIPFLLSIFMLLTVSLSPSIAGQLDDFEDAATRKKERPIKRDDHRSTSPNTSEDTDDDTSFESCIGNIVSDVCLPSFIETCTPLLLELVKIPFILIAYGGAESLHRVQSDSSISDIGPDTNTDDEQKQTSRMKTPKREPGEALIPIIRVDAAYQSAGADIESANYLAEAGYGPVGIFYNTAHFMENAPHDKMDLTHTLILYRMSIRDFAEIDLGIGETILSGNNTHTGTAYAIPLRFKINPYSGVEIRSVFSTIKDNQITDYDLSVYVHYDYFYTMAGYRWLKSGPETLSGPYVGVSIRL